MERGKVVNFRISTDTMIVCMEVGWVHQGQGSLQLPAIVFIHHFRPIPFFVS